MSALAGSVSGSETGGSRLATPSNVVTALSRIGDGAFLRRNFAKGNTRLRLLSPPLPLLAFIHGSIRFTDDVLPHTVGRSEGGADADVERNAEAVAHASCRLPKSIGEMLDVFMRRHFGDDDELVAAPPDEEIVGTQDLPKRLRAAHEDGVTRGVSVMVVDVLEGVEIEHEERVGRTNPVEVVHAAPSVRGEREGVKVRFALKS